MSPLCLEEMEDKWLRFEERKGKPKTRVCAVISKCDNSQLGEIKWHPQWRHYCFFPTIGVSTVYSDRCLMSISDVITKLNNSHKTDIKGK